MGDTPRAVCGHLERGGHQGTEICEGRADHPPGEHVMVPFETWVNEEITWHHKAGRAIPHWLWTIAEEARQFGADQLVRALEDDRERRKRPADDGTVPGTRVDRPEWRQVAETGGEWRAPDDAGRSVVPPSAGKVPPGVEIIHAGSIGPRTRGEGMDIPALIAAIEARIATIREWQGQLAGMREVVSESHQGVMGLAGNMTVGAISAAGHQHALAAQSIDTAIQHGEAAIEQLAAYSAMLSQTL